MSRRNKQKTPAIRAAFTPTRENGPEQRFQKREPMTDEELRAWSEEQAAEHGIHTKAESAAKRGRTLMVFIQGINESVPYEEYRAMLESGFRASGHPDPDKRDSDEIYKTNAERAREEQQAEAAQSAGQSIHEATEPLGAVATQQAQAA